MKKHFLILISLFLLAANIGGRLDAAVCIGRAPDWMGNVINIYFGNRDVTYPKETFWEGTWRLLSGVDNRVGYDKFGNQYKKITPITGTPPIPGFAKGASIIKTGAKIISNSNKVVTNAEKLARILKLNINSPTTQQILNNLDKTVESFISNFRQSSIKSQFPGEFLNKTLKEALKSGNTTVRKLLTDRRFIK